MQRILQLRFYLTEACITISEASWVEHCLFLESSLMMIMFCTAGVSQTGKCWLRLYFEYICLVLQRTGNVEGKNLSDYSDCVTMKFVW